MSATPSVTPGRSYTCNWCGSVSDGTSLSCPSCGATINVAPGTYTDSTPGYGIHLGKSGAAGAPITLLSTVRGAAIVNEAKCAVSGKSSGRGAFDFR